MYDISFGQKVALLMEYYGIGYGEAAQAIKDTTALFWIDGGNVVSVELTDIGPRDLDKPIPAKWVER